MIKVRKETSDARHVVRYHAQDLAGDARSSWPSPQWLGPAAKLLSLRAANTHDLACLLHGVDPNCGRSLRSRKGKINCWRLVFSAPRSVSIASVIDSRVCATFLRLARDYLTYLVAQVQVRNQKGESVDHLAAQGIALEIAHWSNSLDEPMLHIHGVMPNVAFSTVGWRALHTYEFLEQVSALSARFDENLRAEMVGLGYETRQRGRYWHIDGLLDDLPHRTERQHAIDREVAADATGGRTRAAAATRARQPVKKIRDYEVWANTMQQRYAHYPSLLRAIAQAQDAAYGDVDLPHDAPASSSEYAADDLDLPRDEPSQINHSHDTGCDDLPRDEPVRFPEHTVDNDDFDLPKDEPGGGGEQLPAIA